MLNGVFSVKKFFVTLRILDYARCVVTRFSALSKNVLLDRHWQKMRAAIVNIRLSAYQIKRYKTRCHVTLCE